MNKLTKVLLLSLPLACLTAVPAHASTAYRWGSFAGGEGEGGPPHKLPALVPSLTPSRVDASNSFGLAVQEGSVYVWGQGSEGQLGNGTTTEYTTAPVRAHVPATVIATGENRDGAVAIDNEGSVWAWGANNGDAFCLAGTHYDEPVEVPTLSGITEAWGGAGHMLYLKLNGEVVGCGSDGNGQLGNGASSATYPAPQRTLLPEAAAEISSGDADGIARLNDGAVYEWGNDREGQVGNGKEEKHVDTPVKVPLPEAAVAIAVGGDTTSDGTSYAILKGGELYAWGYDRRDECADGATADKTSPVATGLFGFVQVATGGQATFGLKANGVLV